MSDLISKSELIDSINDNLINSRCVYCTEITCLDCVKEIIDWLADRDEEGDDE